MPSNEVDRRSYEWVDAQVTAELGEHWERDAFGHYLLARFCDDPGDGIDYRAELTAHFSRLYRVEI